MTQQEILHALNIDKTDPEAVKGAVAAVQALMTGTSVWPPPPPPPPSGSTSSSGWGRRIKNGAKSVWGGVKKYGGKALRGIGSVASKLPGWGKAIGIGAALIGGGMALMSNTDGKEVDKTKLGGREVEPINNENKNTTSSVNQQSQELIELQKHTALLQAIANKQGIDTKTIYENSTFNKTDIEDNSEQTTASSILSDSMNTTLMASQVGSSKIAAKGLKAVAGRSGLKMAANMGRMAKAANPLGWISLGSGVLKDISGVEEGSGVDKAWSTANAALDGAALGGMIGSVIPGLGTAVGTAVGAAVGGVVGIIDNYGEDIAKEHEKYITEYFNGPVFIKNWPKDIKAFYMKQNDDGKTVAAVDLEVPGAGELMGGSQREENYEKLVNRMKELGMETEGMDWYLNLRKFGGCVHSGFGMGFERLLIYLTGVENIRDVIPYPRTPGNCEY